MQTMFVLGAALSAVLLCSPSSASGVRAAVHFSSERVVDQVGSLPLTFNCQKIKPGGSASAEINCGGSAYTLLISLVVPDDARGKRISCDAYIGGQLSGRFQLATEGVGRRSMFVQVSDPDLYRWRNQRVQIRNTGLEPLCVERIIALDDITPSLGKPFADEDFILSFLVGDISAEHPALERLSHFKKPSGATMAISTEVRYCNARAEADVEGLDAASRRVGWPVVPIMVSWWSGTPREVASNVAFQQVCYSRTDTHDDGPQLKALLGDKWKLQYGLTVPNVWSNTPWQTLNNPDLNALRKSRLDKIMPMAVEKLGNRVLSYITENEPMYWAGAFPDQNYPVKREDLLADFNPHTVAAAARDGVNLDPENFTMEQRLWLQKNLHDYLRDTSGWISDAAAGKPVYTHALLEDHYPMKDTPHARPAMEMAVCPPFITGVEMLWETNLDKIRRLAEYGPWGLVNREEYDARDWNKHIAMAVAVYACGSKMLNSYNWSSCAPEFQESYFNGFAASLPESVRASNSTDKSASKPFSTKRWALGVDPAFPWGTALVVSLSNPSDKPAVITCEVTGAADKIAGGFRRAVVPARHSGPLRIELNQMTTSAQDQDLIVTLRTTDAGLTLLEDSSGRPWFQWILNAAAERRRTQIIQSLIKN